MPADQRHPRPALTRADLPAQLTPETLRELSFQTLRHLADHRNGVLDAEEQRQFDAAFPEVMRVTATRIRDASQRAPRGEPRSTDPTLRRSYERTQQRLAEQTRRARERFPELALDHPDGATNGADTSGTGGAPSTSGSPTTDAHDRDTSTEPDVSPSTLEEEVEQTSDTLDLLEKIASLQQQQLERQETQRLTDTRGFFFAFLVSIAVIVAGIAPLVEAEPHERVLIVVWTVAVTAVAGLVYALIRWVQRSR